MEKLRYGQRIIIVVNSKLHDTGIITHTEIKDDAPMIHVRSDALKGEVVAFRFREEDEGWRHSFPDPFHGPGNPRYNERSFVYQIEAIN